MGWHPKAATQATGSVRERSDSRGRTSAIGGIGRAVPLIGRHMKWLGIAMLLLSISSSDAWSQTAGDSDEQKARMANELLSVIGPGQYVKEVMTLAFEGQPVVGNPKFLGRVLGKLDNDRLSSELHGVFMSNYTLGELQAMRDFYGSPKGRAILRKRPRVLKEIAGIVEQEIARAIADALGETN